MTTESRVYELIMVLAHDMSAMDKNEFINSFTDIVASGNGETLYKEDWGVRSFAFPIKSKRRGRKVSRGHYVMLRVKINQESLEAMQQKYALNKEVMLRFQVRKIDSKADLKDLKLPSNMMTTPDRNQVSA